MAYVETFTGAEGVFTITLNIGRARDVPSKGSYAFGAPGFVSVGWRRRVGRAVFGGPNGHRNVKRISMKRRNRYYCFQYYL